MLSNRIKTAEFRQYKDELLSKMCRLSFEMVITDQDHFR